MNRLHAYLKKEGWLLLSLLVCVLLCLAMGASGQQDASEESRISRVLGAISGAGKVDVAVYYEESVPCGAVVVAEGAGDVGVQLRLINAVTALLGIDSQRVAVYPMEGGN